MRPSAEVRGRNEGWCGLGVGVVWRGVVWFGAVVARASQAPLSTVRTLSAHPQQPNRHCPGCVNVGPSCAGPSFGEAAEELIGAARAIGYSAEGARMEEVGEALRDVEGSC